MLQADSGCRFALCNNRAQSIPEGHNLSRSSSNASSFASVVEENETEAMEDYDTGMVSVPVCVCMLMFVCVLPCI